MRGGREGREKKKVCVFVREHRQPDGGAVRTSSIPSLSCRRATEDPHAPVVTTSPHPSPFLTPPIFCVQLALATPQEFCPHPRRARERERAEQSCGGGIGEGAAPRPRERGVGGQRQQGSFRGETRRGRGGGRMTGGVRSSEALRCPPGSSPLRGSLSREPCPKSLAPGGRRSIVRRWPLQAGPPAATAAASWPLPLLHLLTHPPLHLQHRDNAPSGRDVVLGGGHRPAQLTPPGWGLGCRGVGAGRGGMEAHSIKNDFKETFPECDTFSGQTLMMTDSPPGDGARHDQPAPTLRPSAAESTKAEPGRGAVTHGGVAAMGDDSS